VSFKNSSRFYTRNGVGKYQMDIPEIRAAFVESESLTERIESFCVERQGRIVAGNTPVPILANSKLLVHIFPFSSFRSGNFTRPISVSIPDLKKVAQEKMVPISN